MRVSTRLCILVAVTLIACGVTWWGSNIGGGNAIHHNNIVVIIENQQLDNAMDQSHRSATVAVGGAAAPNAANPSSNHHPHPRSPEYFTWSGGGVAGRSEAATNAFLVEWHVRLREAFDQVGVDLSLRRSGGGSYDSNNKKRHHREGANNTNSSNNMTIKQVAEAFLHTAVDVANNADCLRPLSPSDMLLCHAWAVLTAPHSSGGSGGGGGGGGVRPNDDDDTNSTTTEPTSTAIPLLFHKHSLASMCAHTMSCGVWKRGRYNVRLNATYLETIFQKTAANAAALRERAPLVRNMVHSASSDEYKWLDDRLRRAEYRKQRHVKWVSEWLMTNKTSYPRGEVNLPLDVRPFHQGGAMWMELPAAARDGDAPQTPHFVVQEAAVSPSIGKEMMPRRNDGAGPSSPNERSSSLPLLATTRSTTFSASEALAILYHRAASSSSSASSNGAKYPQCYALFHDRVGGGGSNRPPSCVTPAMNLIVVSGDSIAFQLFRRLLRLVRDGVATPVTIRVGDKYLPTPQRARPNFYFSKWHDIVLAVHPTHDELHTFQSPMLDDYSKHAPNYVKEEGKSLNRFFIDVAQHRWEKHCGPLHARRQRQNRHGHKKMATTMLPTNIENSDEGDDDEELFYLIFIWDPLTVRPRHDALVTCRPIVVGKETVKFRRLYGPYLQRHTKNDMQSLSPQVPAIPLRALGANIGLHVQGSVQWEQQASRSFEKTLSRMAVSCNEDNDEFHQSSFSSPSSSSALLKQLSANDDSYLYRLSPVLLTPAGSPQLFSNVAMSGETAPTVTSTSSVPSNIAANSQSSAALTSGDGTANVSSIETTWKRTTKVVSKVLRVAEVGRTGSLFRWLRVVERARANRDGSGINNKTMTDSNNITSSSRRQPQQQRGRHRRYFSRVRILDVQKAFVMTNNSSSAFEEDGLHETCKSAWLGVTTTEATVMSNDNNNNNNNNNFSSSGGSHGHRRHNNVSPRFVRRLRYILAPILSLISTEENRNNSTVDTNATSMPSREDQGQEQQKRRPTVSYFSPAFRGLDGCGDFATLLTLTALLADIVQDGVREGGRAFE